MTDSTDIFVNGTAANVKQAVQQAFVYNKFNVEWQSEMAGKATRGSKGMNLAFGAMSQYYEIGFEIVTVSEGSFALRLIRSNSGWAGGALGAHKVKKQYEEIVNGLSGYFQTQGLYKGRNPQ